MAFNLFENRQNQKRLNLHNALVANNELATMKPMETTVMDMQPIEEVTPQQIDIEPIQESPEVTDYRNMIKDAPQREDYTPGKGTRIMAAIAGALSGAGGAREGIGAARSILDNNYNQAVGDYQTRLKNQERLVDASNEESRYRSQTSLQKENQRLAQERINTERIKQDRLSNKQEPKWAPGNLEYDKMHDPTLAKPPKRGELKKVGLKSGGFVITSQNETGQWIDPETGAVYDPKLIDHSKIYNLSQESSEKPINFALDNILATAWLKKAKETNPNATLNDMPPEVAKRIAAQASDPNGMKYVMQQSLLGSRQDREQRGDLTGELNFKTKFDNDPVVKQYKVFNMFKDQSIAALENSLKNLKGNNIANDEIALTAFAKTQDPNSVVMPSEVRRILEKQGVVNKFRGWQNRVNGGSPLSESDRKELMKALKVMDGEWRKSYDPVYKDYEGMAKRYGIQLPSFSQPVKKDENYYMGIIKGN